MNNTQADKMLRRLEKLAVQRYNLDLEIRGLVDLGRAGDLDGHCALSWVEIGKALGVSKQAAQQRYGS